MNEKTLLFSLFVLALIFLPGCIDSFFKPSAKVCEVGKTYERTQSKDAECICPQGYEFETLYMGYSNEGGTQVPALGVACVKA